MLEKVEQFFSKIMGGTSTERELKRIRPIVEDINQIAEKYKSLTDDELKAKTHEFRYRLNMGETLDDILPEAFAAVKDTCRRLLGKKWLVRGQEIEWNMIPYDVQLIGGIVLHEGKIAEMATGEGKTLVATMPLYLNALEGKGVHLITVNDYLAQRDCEWMGKIYEFLGLKVAALYGDLDPEQKKHAYMADITYGTNNEFGFDYLRDNMTTDVWSVVQRPLHYAIVDEVDSVLIDEARTPLIISGAVGAPRNIYYELKPIVSNLYTKQKELVEQFVREGKDLLEKDEELAGLMLLRAQRGDPKNQELLDLQTSEFWVKKLIEKILGQHEINKTMGQVDGELYYTIDEKSHVLDITEKGRIFLSGGRDQDIAEKIQKLDELDQALYDLSEQKKPAQYFTLDPISGLCNGITFEGQLLLCQITKRPGKDDYEKLEKFVEHFANLETKISQDVQEKRTDKNSIWRENFNFSKRMDRMVNNLTESGAKYLQSDGSEDFSQFVGELQNLLKLIQNIADVDAGGQISRGQQDRRREIIQTFFQVEKQLGAITGLTESGKLALFAMVCKGDPFLVPYISKIASMLDTAGSSSVDDKKTTQSESITEDRRQEYFEFSDNGTVLKHISEKGRIALLGGNPDIYILPDRSLVEEQDRQVKQILDRTLNQSAFDYAARVQAAEKLQLEISQIYQYVQTDVSKLEPLFYKREKVGSLDRLDFSKLGYNFLSDFAQQVNDIVLLLDKDLGRYSNEIEQIFDLDENGNILGLADTEIERLLGFNLKSVAEKILKWQQTHKADENANSVQLRIELDEYLATSFNNDNIPSLSRRFEDVERLQNVFKSLFSTIKRSEFSDQEKQRFLRRYLDFDSNGQAAKSSSDLRFKGLSNNGIKSLTSSANERFQVTEQLVKLLDDINIDADSVFELDEQQIPKRLLSSARQYLVDGLPFFSYDEELKAFRDDILHFSSKKVSTRSELDALLPKDKAQLRAKRIMLEEREMNELLANAHAQNFVMTSEEIEHWFRIHFERKPRAILESRRNKLWQDYSQVEDRVQNISQLLRAYTLYKNDVDYVVKAVEEGEMRRAGTARGRKAVMIVDQFTGRLMPGRRFSDGLHEALEAKEGVEVQSESQTLATITLQNFFRIYHKLAGMTGTAETESQEFFSTYELEVIVIPTNKPVIRKDNNDVIYRTKKEKYDAIIDEALELHEKGLPILIGTVSVDVSQHLSTLFTHRGIPVANWLKKGDVTKELESGRFHTVLNAKYHKSEAEIVAKAGLPGSITIATNMAGRGTDIKLTPDVIKHGGLQILGSEKHEARRIDRQLRGRAGRQGDPGASRFYLSLEDDLMRLFGSDRITNVMSRLGDMQEGERIEHPLITRSIERAQKKVEERNFEIRKNLLEYDNVLNDQRKIIYKRRQNLLGFAQAEDFVESKTKRFFGEEDDHTDWKLDELIENLKEFFGAEPDFTLEDLQTLKQSEIKEKIQDWVLSKLEQEKDQHQMQERHRIYGYCSLDDILDVLIKLKIKLHNAGSRDTSKWNLEGIVFEFERILGVGPEWLMNQTDLPDADALEEKIVSWGRKVYSDKVENGTDSVAKIIFESLDIKEMIRIYLTGIMDRHLNAKGSPATWTTDEFLKDIERIFFDVPSLGSNELKSIRREVIRERVLEWMNDHLNIEQGNQIRHRILGYFSNINFAHIIVDHCFQELGSPNEQENNQLIKEQQDFLEKVFGQPFNITIDEAEAENSLKNQTMKQVRLTYSETFSKYSQVYNDIMLANATIEELIEASIIALVNKSTDAKADEKTKKLFSQQLDFMFLSKPDKALPSGSKDEDYAVFREQMVAWGLNLYKVYADRVERFRQERISSEIVRDSVLMMIDETIYNIISSVLNSDKILDPDMANRLETDCRLVFRQAPRLRDESDEALDPNLVLDEVSEWAKKLYINRVNEIGSALATRYERYYVLEKIDENWRQHLSGVDELREGIGLRGYGQKDPLLEYKSEAYKMFVKTIDSINRDVVSTLFKVFDVGGEIEEQQLRRVEPQQYNMTHSQVEVFKQVMGAKQSKASPVQAGTQPRKTAPIVKTKKVGRNDPCPCGSGKKYKNCCGRAN